MPVKQHNKKLNSFCCQKDEMMTEILRGYRNEDFKKIEYGNLLDNAVSRCSMSWSFWNCGSDKKISKIVFIFNRVRERLGL